MLTKTGPRPISPIPWKLVHTGLGSELQRADGSPIDGYADMKVAHYRVNHWDELRAERDRLRDAAQKLVEALPRCTYMIPGEDADTQCFKTAFWDFEEFEGTGNGSFCDEHVHSVAEQEWTFGFGYAEPLRALLAALETK